MNPTKNQCMTVSRSRTAFLPHPDLFIDDVLLTLCDFFKILGVIFDNKFAFEQHHHSVSSSVAQKIGLLRKSIKVFGDQSVLQNCFKSFILPCLEYCSPVWCSTADSHLWLLNRNLDAIRFLIPGLSFDLWHRHSINSLCMLFKIFRNPKHPCYSDFPGLFCPAKMFLVLTTFLSMLRDLTLLNSLEDLFQLSVHNGMIFLIML